MIEVVHERKRTEEEWEKLIHELQEALAKIKGTSNNSQFVTPAKAGVQ